MKGLIKTLLREYFLNEKNESINYEIEHLDSYNGQHNYEIGMYINGEIVGLAQYTLYNNELTISHIFVRPEMRRRGYGSRIIAFLKKEYPEYQYQPSMKTDLGSKFIHKDVNPYQDLNEDTFNALESELQEEVTSSFTAYHGSPTKIERFVDEFVGGKDATDRHGPGIYFTTKIEETYGYAGRGYVHHVEIANSKFLDSIERSKGYLRKYRGDVKKLIMMAPNWKMDAQNWAANPKEGLNKMVDNFIQYNSNEKDVFLQVWIDVYRGIEVQFVRNMVKLGYGGLLINGGFNSDNGGDHIVVYNPELITISKVEFFGDKSMNEQIILPIMKNMVKAPNMGSKFGQDVEPSGTYVSHDDRKNKTPIDNYKLGKVTFNNPLIIDITDDTIITYKNKLSQQFKAKGKNLTNKLMEKGYDGLITRWPDGNYNELILFPNSKYYLS